jgi:N-succinyldiaminopimelate aminotransferase
MRAALAAKLAPFGTTIFTEITRRAVERGAVNLGQGFPDFDGPEFVKQAAIDAIRAGHGQYARMAGAPALAASLARKYRRDYGLEFDAESEITVTSGATEAIFAAIQGLCAAGDEVVVFEPYYDSYKPALAMAGARARVVTLRAPRWEFDASELERAVNPKTRAVLLNSPHNPTGKVFSPEELAAVAEICVSRDLLCITDEVYEHLVYEGEHLPAASVPGMRERTVTISSFGKTFSLTGWKVGWAAAPSALSSAVRAAHQFITFATATPLQQAAAVALASGPDYFDALREDYRRRRDYLCRELERVGFALRPPAGTYFICAGFRRFGFEDDVAFCRHLIDQIGVAAIPPSAFYDHPEHGKNYVRFAFCKKEETLREAVRRLEKLCE